MELLGASPPIGLGKRFSVSLHCTLFTLAQRNVDDAFSQTQTFNDLNRNIFYEVKRNVFYGLKQNVQEVNLATSLLDAPTKIIFTSRQQVETMFMVAEQKSRLTPGNRFCECSFTGSHECG